MQWHTTPGFVDRPWANDGDGQVRGITGYIHRNSQPNNSYYCKYGSTTKFGCGFVVANNFSPSYVPNASATFMRLYNPDDVDLASGGDSGGPVYTPTKAVGIISGSLGNDAIYMAANDIVSGLSLSILTT